MSSFSNIITVIYYKYLLDNYDIIIRVEQNCVEIMWYFLSFTIWLSSVPISYRLEMWDRIKNPGEYSNIMQQSSQISYIAICIITKMMDKIIENPCTKIGVLFSFFI